MADEVNITPDMIENLVNMLKNNTENNAGSNTGNNAESNTLNNAGNNFGQSENSNSDGSFEKSDNSNCENSFNQSGNFNRGSGSDFKFDGFNLGNLDFKTIMKLKSVMDSMNSNNNPDSQLLYSLKPYLRKSRQDKLDQYINLLKISKVAGIFK